MTKKFGAGKSVEGGGGDILSSFICKLRREKEVVIRRRGGKSFFRKNRDGVPVPDTMTASRQAAT